MTHRYIHIQNWEKYQARSDKDLPWIKFYVRNTSRDEWLDLSFADRGLLTSLWIEYARVNKGQVSILRGLREDTASLSRRLGQRVLSPQLIRLQDGDWIEFCASKRRTVVGLEGEEDKETPISPNGKPPSLAARRRQKKQVELAQGHYESWLSEGMAQPEAAHTLREIYPSSVTSLVLGDSA